MYDLIKKTAINVSESYLYPFLGFEPDPARYDQSRVTKGDSYDVISSLVKNNSTVLEIGCGTGSLLEYLARSRKCEVYGIEPNEDRADLAKMKGLSVINSYLSATTCLPRESYDYIIFADVLEHLDDPSELLSNSRKFLRDGGSYIVSVPNMIHWSVRMRILLGRLEYDQYGLLDATHLRWFSKATISTYLERLGFKIIDVKYSIGLNLACHSKIPFFRNLSQVAKIAILSRLTRANPSLFACQNVVLIQPGLDAH